MATETVQARLPKKLVEKIDSLVEKDVYSSRSDFVRDAARRLAALDAQIGSIPNTGDSVKEVRDIRKKLSKEPFDLDKINNL